MDTDNPLNSPFNDISPWQRHTPDVLEDMIDTLVEVKGTALRNAQTQELVSMIFGMFGLHDCAEAVRAVEAANKQVALRVDQARAEIRAHLKEMAR